MRVAAYSMIMFGAFLGASVLASCKKKTQVYLDRKLREHLSERQIDKMVEDSFPASDPPSTY